jgi:hypothetical protein
MGNNENLENMVQELRRGLLMLAVLGQLGKQQYGYAFSLLAEAEWRSTRDALSPAAAPRVTGPAGIELERGSGPPAPVLRDQQRGEEAPAPAEERVGGHGGGDEQDVEVGMEGRMNLIELYVAEVGKRLPLKGRKDIEAELRSTLEDMWRIAPRRRGQADGR